jgi:putative ABC transport system permease protein
MLLVVLIATVACFALVGASAKTEQVTVRGTLEADSRAAYDLLVRPSGSVSAAERQGDTLAFHGAAAGTLLGQAIIVQVHAADYAAAATCAVLGLALAADIHYTATRDRAGEHALLRAIGWTDANLTRLAAAETAITAIAGATTGAPCRSWASGLPSAPRPSAPARPPSASAPSASASASH